MNQGSLAFSRPDFPGRTVSPLLEMGAYEHLWLQAGQSFKKLAQLFAAHPERLPSDFVETRSEAEETAQEVLRVIREASVREFGLRVHHAGEYPVTLRDARHPVELLYYRGWWNLIEAPSVAMVGTRRPTQEGRQRTRQLVRHLVHDGWTVVSGLARGIDTEAHTEALKLGSPTIAVLGTPITTAYPKENHELQESIAANHLLISQVPILRYMRQSPRVNRFFFPERNKTMSALTRATVIIEASDTSGTLIQARHALEQGRKLFILQSCFENPGLSWPEKYEARGAIRVRSYDDIRSVLGAASHHKSSE